jgi:hypothetical protein
MLAAFRNREQEIFLFNKQGPEASRMEKEIRVLSV